MKTILAAAGGVLIGAVAMGIIQPAVAQPQTASATTSFGVRAEVLRVEGNCVVVLARAGSGTSDHLFALPCQQ